MKPDVYRLIYVNPGGPETPPSRLMLEVESPNALDLAKAFFDFMLGCGFSDQSALRGFEYVVEEMSPQVYPEDDGEGDDEAS